MHRSSRIGYSSLSSFITLLFAFLLIAFPALALAASASGSSVSQPSQPAGADLICHTEDPSECYPRIFQPTDEFQTVHEDQELPPGLHVRLNIWSGKREAKINDPTEIDPSLEGLPVDHGIIAVDPEQPDSPVIPKGAPAYDNVGAVKGPEHEALYFYEALEMLKSGVVKDDKAFDSALEDMEDICHDIYYGVKVTEDPEVMKALLCLMADQGVDAPSSDTTPRNSQAAAILAGALSNNPTALKAVAKTWPEFMSSTCPGAKEKGTLGDTFYSSIMPSNGGDLDSSSAAKTVKAKVSAMNGLIKDDSIRAEFLANNGMKHLLEVLTVSDTSNKAWGAAQRKAGQLALDNFLDEEMGATLGQWPTKAKLSKIQCETQGFQSDEGCWHHHVERIMKENSKDSDHWSKDLHERLSKVKVKEARFAGRSEL
jgi:nucleotide exchange factor SIL1